MAHLVVDRDVGQAGIDDDFTIVGVVDLTCQIHVPTFGVQRRHDYRTVSTATAWIVVNLVVVVRRTHQLGIRPLFVRRR